MKARTDLTRLLAGLCPRLNEGLWVDVQVASLPAGAHPLVTVAEEEGVTLEVHSALEAIAG